MRVSQIILRVSDLDESVSFWTGKVGFELSMQAGSFAFLDAGAIQLTLNAVDDMPEDPSLTEVVIGVEDIHASYEEMSGRGVSFEVEPRAVTSDGSRDLFAAHFYDPDGHLASITGWVG